MYGSATLSEDGACCPDVVLVVGAFTIVPASAAASILCPSATVAESDDIAEPDGADMAGVGIGDEGAAPPELTAPPVAPPVDMDAPPISPPPVAGAAGAGDVLAPFAICRILVGSPPTAITLRRTSSSDTGLPDA